MAESPCFADNGQDKENEDCTQMCEAYYTDGCTWAPEIYFGAAAGRIPRNKEELAVEATLGQRPKTQEDKKKI